MPIDQAPKVRYWCGAINSVDDFGAPIKRVFYDAKTVMGPWAIMSPASWKRYGVGHLGTGFGQKYLHQPSDDRWLKVEG